MTLEQLKIFTAAAEKGSISAAARSLFISHSTVSRALGALEQELDTVLMERTGNKCIRLTRQGEALKEEAEKILSAVEELPNRLKQEEK